MSSTKNGIIFNDQGECIRHYDIQCPPLQLKIKKIKPSIYRKDAVLQQTKVNDETYDDFIKSLFIKGAISVNSKLVKLVLLSYLLQLSPQKKPISPSFKTISEACGISKIKISALLEQMEAENMISVEKTQTGHRRITVLTEPF